MGRDELYDGALLGALANKRLLDHPGSGKPDADRAVFEEAVFDGGGAVRAGDRLGLGVRPREPRGSGPGTDGL
jgi:hypothetical protein